jgi:hypothetical protein
MHSASVQVNKKENAVGEGIATLVNEMIGGPRTTKRRNLSSSANNKDLRPYQISHSYRNASMGSNREAFQAG